MSHCPEPSSLVARLPYLNLSIIQANLSMMQVVQKPYDHSNAFENEGIPNHCPNVLPAALCNVSSSRSVKVCKACTTNYSGNTGSKCSTTRKIMPISSLLKAQHACKFLCSTSSQTNHNLKSKQLPTTPKNPSHHNQNQRPPWAKPTERSTTSSIDCQKASSAA